MEHTELHMIAPAEREHVYLRCVFEGLGFYTKAQLFKGTSSLGNHSRLRALKVVEVSLSRGFYGRWVVGGVGGVGKLLVLSGD